VNASTSWAPRSAGSRAGGRREGKGPPSWQHFSSRPGISITRCATIAELGSPGLGEHGHSRARSAESASYPQAPFRPGHKVERVDLTTTPWRGTLKSGRESAASGGLQFAVDEKFGGAERSADLRVGLKREDRAVDVRTSRPERVLPPFATARSSNSSLWPGSPSPSPWEISHARRAQCAQRRSAFGCERGLSAARDRGRRSILAQAAPRWRD